MTENEGGASEVDGQRRTETQRATKADRQGQNRPEAALERGTHRKETEPRRWTDRMEADGERRSRQMESDAGGRSMMQVALPQRKQRTRPVDRNRGERRKGATRQPSAENTGC